MPFHMFLFCLLDYVQDLQTADGLSGGGLERGVLHVEAAARILAHASVNVEDVRRVQTKHGVLDNDNMPISRVDLRRAQFPPLCHRT